MTSPEYHNFFCENALKTFIRAEKNFGETKIKKKKVHLFHFLHPGWCHAKLKNDKFYMVQLEKLLQLIAIICLLF
jgi:hypothetical protein